MNDDYAEITARDTVRIERLLPGSLQRVWDYLTVGDLRAQWLAGGDMPERTDADFALRFHNNALTDDANPPEKYRGRGGPHALPCRVTVWEPPHRLAYRWGEDGDEASEVLFELESRGDGVHLLLTHTRLPAHHMASVAAGWHTHLGILIARLSGDAPSGFWRTHTRLEADYAQRLAND